MDIIQQGLRHADVPNTVHGVMTSHRLCRRARASAHTHTQGCRNIL